jgi:large subunit ribosomal protein L5
MAATTDKTKSPLPANSKSRLKLLYDQEITKTLKGELKLKNVNEVPKLEKIVINCGLGKAKDDKKIMEVATNTLRRISGQQPVQTTAKTSVAGFKLREGSKIGLKVTLRGERMYEFMDRLINLVIPRLRDFHGVSPKSFDRQGNYSLGLKDQSVFPELSYEETAQPHGLQVIFVINAKGSQEARSLLEQFGLPFEKEERK